MTIASKIVTAAGNKRYAYSDLLSFATRLSAAAGLAGDRAGLIAENLLEADLMGHSTHGLAQLPGVLRNVESGALRAKGDPEVIRDHGAAVVWDSASLPGPWLMAKAIDEACARAKTSPVVTYIIRRSGNIACLGAYLRRATDRGMVIWIMNSDPAMRTVVPAGGIEPQIAPNPMAFGYPTKGDPILIDISTSPIANGWIRRWAAEGTRLPEPWLQDAEGKLSDDPSTLFGKPPGSMLPLGGMVLGHKGFALGLIVEVLTAALGGTGRANPEASAGGTPVFLQIINPDFFAGSDALNEEADWLANACRNSRSRPGDPAVRMPGDTANAMRRSQLREGVVLHPSIIPELRKLAEKLHVDVPRPLS
jgi:LDH2 family malate/lactate/ureidoglycolate dehydrogenase